MENVQRRVVAKKEFSVVGEGSTIENFSNANHNLISFSLKQLATTPKGASISSPKVNLPNELMSSETEFASMHEYAPGTKSIVFSVIIPGISNHVSDPLKGLWTSIKKSIKSNFGYHINKDLIIQSMTTFHIPTKTVCTWKSQAFAGYEGTEYRLVLKTINGKLADEEDYQALIVISDSMRYKDCYMEGKMHYSCPLR